MQRPTGTHVRRRRLRPIQPLTVNPKHLAAFMPIVQPSVNLIPDPKEGTGRGKHPQSHDGSHASLDRLENARKMQRDDLRQLNQLGVHVTIEFANKADNEPPLSLWIIVAQRRLDFDRPLPTYDLRFAFGLHRSPLFFNNARMSTRHISAGISPSRFSTASPP